MTIVSYDTPIHADGHVFTRLRVRSKTTNGEVFGFRHRIDGVGVTSAVWKQRLAVAQAADAARATKE
jgi:hypothetical protein